MCSKILVSGGDYLAKTIPMIITNNNILIKDKESDEFKTFTMPALSVVPNIPFYHQFAERIAECQYYFKEFMKTIYGKKLSKYVFAIIVPDDTSKLESIFINEFFVNSDTCKAVAQMPMALAISKDETIQLLCIIYIKDHIPSDLKIKLTYSDVEERGRYEKEEIIHIDIDEDGELISKMTKREQQKTIEISKKKANGDR
mgnify:CR=1 FL=1